MGLNPDSPEDESGIKKAAENSECFMAGPYGRHIGVVVGVACGSHDFWLVVVFFMNNVNGVAVLTQINLQRCFLKATPT